jgi:hypothetical protein
MFRASALDIVAQFTESGEGLPQGDEDKTSLEDKILKEAHARLALAEEAEDENRKLALDDLKFRAGEQWPENVVNERERDGRPCLVINRIPQFIQQVTNDQRQNRPSIKVHPVDDHGDVETGKTIQGLIRHIEYNSNADVAYDTAFDSAATGGFGFFRIVTDYVSPTSFEQEILIKRVRNPFSVFLDPYSQEPDGSDAAWALIIEDLSEDEYKARYPKSELASPDRWSAVGNHAPGWVKEGSARVAEYFYKETEDKEIVLLSDGQVVLAEALARGLPPGVEVVRKRIASIPVIKWCKLNGCEILEQTDWPGSYIPIVPVYGTEYYIDGKRVLEGIVRNAKDSQRMYNYWASAETEAIALAPRSPFIAAEGQLEGHEGEWETANRRNHSVLTYKPTDVNGNPIGPPQRQVFEPAVQAITNARMIAADDLKATTGIYDAALGAKSNESSGVAIQRRNIQAQTSNFHFVDNLTRSLRHAGRILVDLIPKIYDTGRAARIIGDDGEQKVVRLNEVFDENGKQVLYRMDAGKYDVTVDVGPSFASKRQEAVAAMMEMTRAAPQLMQVAGDLLFKAMDTPYAAEIADRMKKTLPPGLADDQKGKEPLPPEVQAQMQQMSQMVEQLTGKLNELQSEREQKLIELESKERIEMKKLEVQLEIERAKLDAKDALALLNSEIAQINSRMELLRADQPFEYGDEEIAQSMEPGMTEPPMEEPYPTGGESPGLPMEGPEPHEY